MTPRLWHEDESRGWEEYSMEMRREEQDYNKYTTGQI